MKSKIRDTWEAAAPGWAKWESKFSRGIEKATVGLLDVAGVQSGSRVLDVASGAGAQALLAASRVGPEGKVVASDISETMLEHLRKNAEASSVTNIETAIGTAEDIAENNGPFDAAICRFGLMLFPDPGSAVGAVCKSLKPGGRFGVMVVASPEENPFFSKSMGILLRHANKQPPAPGQPGLFALSKPGVLEEVLSGGGLEDVRTETVRAPMLLSSADEALEMMQQAFGAYRAVVADLNDADRESAWAEVRDFLGGLANSDGFAVDLVIIIGSGARPE